jgi:hypothetical protein
MYHSDHYNTKREAPSVISNELAIASAQSSESSCYKANVVKKEETAFAAHKLRRNVV